MPATRTLRLTPVTDYIRDLDQVEQIMVQVTRHAVLAMTATPVDEDAFSEALYLPHARDPVVLVNIVAAWSRIGALTDEPLTEVESPPRWSGHASRLEKAARGGDLMRIQNAVRDTLLDLDDADVKALLRALAERYAKVITLAGGLKRVEDCNAILDGVAASPSENELTGLAAVIVAMIAAGNLPAARAALGHLEPRGARAIVRLAGVLIRTNLALMALAQVPDRPEAVASRTQLDAINPRQPAVPLDSAVTGLIQQILIISYTQRDNRDTTLARQLANLPRQKAVTAAWHLACVAGANLDAALTTTAERHRAGLPPR